MILEIGRHNTKIQIDPEDHEKFFKKGNCLNVTSHGYVRIIAGGKQTYLHRAIMDAPKGKEVDHINGNRLDNRKENLRICTRTENARNTGSSRRFKGVHYSKEYKYWVAQITKDYKCHHIGIFKTAKAAALEYNNWAKKLHGEFARLNVII